MFRLSILAAAAALLTTPLLAGEPAGNEAVTTFTLDNGMQVVVVEDHRAPAVQQMIWYRAGSADEPKGASGIAHFLEHLLFKATDNLEEGEFSAIVAANGGRDNAFTSYDYTAYFQRVAADRLELMMTMEADRMKNIRLTPENILSERGVILEERNQRIENNPRALFGEEMNAAQYLNHPYGIPVIGWMHEMEQLGYDDVMAFYDAHYAPNNAILVVSGDVEPEAVRALAEETYGKIPANPAIVERQRPQEPPQRAARRLTFEDPRVAQPTVRRTYLAPERDPGAQETAAALELLAEILGGGTNSVLDEKLQFQQKLAVYAGAFYSGTALDDTGFSVVVVPVPGVTLDEAEAAMDQVLADFMVEGIDQDHLDRIKAQNRARRIYERDSVDSVGSRYGRALTSGLTLDDIHAWPEIIEAVTVEDIMVAARDVLRLEHSVTGWITRPSEEEMTQ